MKNKACLTHCLLLIIGIVLIAFALSHGKEDSAFFYFMAGFILVIFSIGERVKAYKKRRSIKETLSPNRTEQ